MRSYFARVAMLAIVLTPEIATACSVCFSGRSDETRVAFIATTALLTALPLLLIGGFVWWLRRRAMQMQQSERALRAAPEPQPRVSEATS
jgi:NADH:ubiquinone oxidoreductase subunit 3 (subunit A)